LQRRTPAELRTRTVRLLRGREGARHRAQWGAVWPDPAVGWGV